MDRTAAAAADAGMAGTMRDKSNISIAALLLTACTVLAGAEQPDGLQQACADFPRARAGHGPFAGRPDRRRNGAAFTDSARPGRSRRDGSRDLPAIEQPAYLQLGVPSGIPYQQPALYFHARFGSRVRAHEPNLAVPR